MVWLTRIAVGLLCVGLLGWSVLAVLLAPIVPQWLAVPLAILLPVIALSGFLAERPSRRVPFLIGFEFVAVLAVWSLLEPSHEREWQADVAKLPHAELRGDRLTVYDVRNALYRSETDFTVRWEKRDYDVAKLRSLDLFLVYWGSPAIAHTIMSFGFEGDDYLAFSIETRKEVGESYSALRGFFRNYELIYIAADERDVVRLRTNYRGEEVYLYRLDVKPEGVRRLLLAYVDAMNDLHAEAKWYNALTDNCTTTIQHLAAPSEERDWRSWRLIVNGYLDELAYDIGAVDRSLPFEELREKSHINERAHEAGDRADFSARIRAGLPTTARGNGAFVVASAELVGSIPARKEFRRREELGSRSRAPLTTIDRAYASPTSYTP